MISRIRYFKEAPFVVWLVGCTGAARFRFAPEAAHVRSLARSDFDVPERPSDRLRAWRADLRAGR